MTIGRGAWILALGTVLTGIAAPPAARAQDGKTGARPPYGTVVDVRAREAAMNAALDSAMARARATSGQLLARLRRPPPGLSNASVKVSFSSDSHVEQIWVRDVRLKGDTLVGRLVDDAQHFPQYHRGDWIRVLPAEISDWMTVESGRACGGFTDRVLVVRVTPAERKRYYQSMGIRRLPPGDLVCDTEG
jgi:uncharacterized protein YegJ (DUF2314 family)